MNKNRVVLGMSGGVDSSVAAYLLKKAGYEVIGVTMQIWQDSGKTERDGGCCSLSAVEDARRVANKLDIPYYVMNFKDIFQKTVIDYFIEEYTQGRTPNPCIACNRYVKFEELLERAHTLDAYYVATGHYAKVTYDNEKKRYLLKKSETDTKDRTYALYNLTQEQLRHTLMPLGEFNDKEEVRRIARDLDLIVADKPDSQEICFVEDDYGDFISKNSNKTIEPGYFKDTKGNILGQHKGIIHYTIGQRKGLGIALGRPVYVVDIDPDHNTVIVGDKEDILETELIADDINFISIDDLKEPMKVLAKIRYNFKEVPATIYPLEEGRIRVVFDHPVRAITPGQAVVFYQDDILVGGGTITKKSRA